eukprot:TRINITY_DN13394_c0_g2_i7.p1 TRINITY_DN13394_c0_g2~~TRINITY_DN13394_c0_g2_i7.p1  ORF type:complete len:344 (-),score=59.92 TRINITY_DN13394_c0_g2_i7:314-1345(-)
MLDDVSEEDLTDSNVILRCEKVHIVCDQQLLVEESEYFRARFSKNWKRNSQFSQIDNEDYSTLRTFNFPEFSPLAFKTVFEYLIGYSSMMKDCNNFLELCDMLRLVDYLIIPKLIKMIRDKMRQLPLDAFNVIEAYEASHDLYSIERYKGTAASLQDRCIAYCGANLASWQGLISFIVDNQDYLASVMELIEHLGEEKECVIRSKFCDVSKMTVKDKKTLSTPHIRGNLLWHINIRKSTKENQEYLSSYLSYDTNPEVSCKLKKREIRLYKPSDFTFYKKHSTKVVNYDNESNSRGWNIFELWSDVLGNGFVKDDEILMEARFVIKSTSGIPSSLEVPESIIR